MGSLVRIRGDQHENQIPNANNFVRQDPSYQADKANIRRLHWSQNLCKITTYDQLSRSAGGNATDSA
jgi:hypothetical protein